MPFTFPIFSAHASRVAHGVFTDTAGPFSFFGPRARIISFKDQLHGDSVQTIKNTDAADYFGDAFLTAMPHVALTIRLADCCGVLLFDPIKHAIANIHAGWRGVAKRIITKTIGEMAHRFRSRPEDLLAAITPSIGPCCFEFKNAGTLLPKHMDRFVLEEDYVDLWGASVGQLAEAGVPKKHIECARVCTACNPEYPSARRDGGDAKRFTCAIMLK